eukprot:5170143-Ditylum_brightwellii.AAC.1
MLSAWRSNTSDPRSCFCYTKSHTSTVVEHRTRSIPSAHGMQAGAKEHPHYTLLYAILLVNGVIWIKGNSYVNNKVYLPNLAISTQKTFMGEGGERRVTITYLLPSP